MTPKATTANRPSSTNRSRRLRSDDGEVLTAAGYPFACDAIESTCEHLRMIGPLDHVYYWTRDMDAAVTFYRDVVGLSMLRREGDEWAEFEAGDARFALHGGDVGSTSGTAVFRVDDLEAARWSLERNGASFDDYVGEVPGRARFATFRDPDGNPVQLIEYLT